MALSDRQKARILSDYYKGVDVAEIARQNDCTSSHVLALAQQYDVAIKQHLTEIETSDQRLDSLRGLERAIRSKLLERLDQMDDKNLISAFKVITPLVHVADGRATSKTEHVSTQITEVSVIDISPADTQTSKHPLQVSDLSTDTSTSASTVQAGCNDSAQIDIDKQDK